MSKSLVAYYSASGVTAKKLASPCPGAVIRKGRLLNGRPSMDTLKQWVEHM